MKKILIANRGEIASRIIKTCKKLGIETVAIYSEADIDMPFVKEADESFLIGPPPIQKSYLLADEIVKIAVREGVDGIHPGYGLLSENAEFARKVRDANITFIGPDIDTLIKMGDKIVSRQTMREASIPVIPGTDKGVIYLDEVVTIAKEIGFPVMLKASAGGGGVGMICCEDEQMLTQQFETMKKRAKIYFDSDVVFLEKFIANARHIEVQIFGDGHGNIVHLFDRNCSVQRRNQKVIEETPSPQLTQETRGKLYTAAVKAAQAVQYKSAGTVEFVVDEDENFYFIEMNTRLQVEHTITEEITGFDLVAWQIGVARGEELPVKSQEDIHIHGHAIEFRVYAEDPVTFMPSPGKITTLNWGRSSDSRVDGGYAVGNIVTPYYDPLIAKVIIHAKTREEAIDASIIALARMKVEGIKTNLPLFSTVLLEKTFLQGTYTTSILKELTQREKRGV